MYQDEGAAIDDTWDLTSRDGASWWHKERREGSEEYVSLGSDKSDGSPSKWLANVLGVEDPAQLTVSLLHLWM